MKLLNRLKNLFAGTGRSSARWLDVAVRCKRCGETIHGQIDLHNDLSPKYDGDDLFYFCRKGLIGRGEGRCFETVTVEYTFDANRQVIDCQVQGGTIVEKEREG
jgi:hypothetical protein